MGKKVEYINCAHNNIFKTIEHLAEIHKKDNLVAIAVAAVDKNGNCVTGYIDDDEIFALLGGITFLQRRILKNVEDEENL